ncbi:hypothetical protein FKM82_003469 [Ascaphus truei]
MDKWVIRKRSEPAAGECAGVSEADELSDSEPSGKKQKTRAWKSVTRNFQEIWELKFVVTQVNKKTVCLLCKKSFSDNKVDSLKKHFQNKHSAFNNKFPVDGPSRVREIARLKSQFQDQKSSLKQFLSSNELVTLASYKAVWILARKKKPFSDAEIVKDILVTVMETLLENYESKVKNDILQKVQNLQLSRRTVVRRVLELSKNIEEQLLEQLKDCLCFSLALDESTDCTDTAQLIFWVRFVLSNFTIREEILVLCGLRGQTCATDVLEHFISASKQYDLDQIKLASITTDGAPAMIGRKSGFVSRLKQHLSENGVKNMLPSFHCILHQENLCAQMLETDTLKTLMDKVVKIVNYIRSGSSLIHRQFVEALKECDFLVEKRQIKFFSDIENPSWQCDLHFLCDIMAHLNELNVKLQGKGKVICELAQHIQEFKSKLNLIQVQTQKDDLTHFANLNRFLEKNEECGLLDVKRQLYVNWIKNLSQKFESRFSDFNDFKLAFKFLRDPFHFDITNSSKEISTLLSLDKRGLEDDLLSFHTISKLLSMFGSTWVCESTFSMMDFIKSKHRSRIVDVNLEAELRCALSSDIQPKFMQLVRNKDCQISH